MVGAVTGSALIDRFGRRTLLLGSTTTLVGMLAIIIGLLSSHGNSTQANAGITFETSALEASSEGMRTLQPMTGEHARMWIRYWKSKGFIKSCTH